MKQFGEFLIFFTLLLLVGLAGYQFGIMKQPTTIIETHTDTIVVKDTVTVIEPVEVIREVVKYEAVQITDTMVVNDTIYAILPRERVHYQDSLVKVVFSGIHPSLDTLQVFNNTKYITKILKEPPKKWHIGITAGFGLNGNKADSFVGVGLTYSLYSF